MSRFGLRRVNINRLACLPIPELVEQLDVRQDNGHDVLQQACNLVNRRDYPVFSDAFPEVMLPSD